MAPMIAKKYKLSWAVRTRARGIWISILDTIGYTRAAKLADKANNIVKQEKIKAAASLVARNNKIVDAMESGKSNEYIREKFGVKIAELTEIALCAGIDMKARNKHFTTRAETRELPKHITVNVVNPRGPRRTDLTLASDLTDTDKNEIKRLYDEQKTLVSICNKFNISTATLYTILAEFGVCRPKTGKTKEYPLQNARNARMVKMHARGWSRKDIWEFVQRAAKFRPEYSAIRTNPDSFSHLCKRLKIHASPLNDWHDECIEFYTASGPGTLSPQDLAKKFNKSVDVVRWLAKRENFVLLDGRKIGSGEIKQSANSRFGQGVTAAKISEMVLKRNEHILKMSKRGITRRQIFEFAKYMADRRGHGEYRFASFGSFAVLCRSLGIEADKHPDWFAKMAEFVRENPDATANTLAAEYKVTSSAVRYAAREMGITLPRDKLGRAKKSSDKIAKEREDESAKISDTIVKWLWETRESFSAAVLKYNLDDRENEKLRSAVIIGAREYAALQKYAGHELPPYFAGLLAATREQSAEK